MVLLPLLCCVSHLQDTHHLYFLFDLMPGGDLMDVLVAEAKIIKHPVPQKGSLRQGCLSPKVCWQAGEVAGVGGSHVGVLVDGLFSVRHGA
jgi:cGMP-dependent protein kinase 2